MKAGVLILLFAVCAVECRKTYVPINKNANIDFINMESGGVKPPVQPQPKAPATPTPATPTTKSPTPSTSAPVAKPTLPPIPITVKPPQPAQQPNPPANQKPVGIPTTTPLPGSVKHLIQYYDSQGKASPIRPYSYSQAVKQG